MKYVISDVSINSCGEFNEVRILKWESFLQRLSLFTLWSAHSWIIILHTPECMTLRFVCLHCGINYGYAPIPQRAPLSALHSLLVIHLKALTATLILTLILTITDTGGCPDPNATSRIQKFIRYMEYHEKV